jgi:hypothetical protein
MSLMEISEIAKMLAADIDTLVRILLPAARMEGPEWRIGSCAGEPGRSMAIHRHGSKRGLWSDFSDRGKGGDAVELVAQVLFAGDKKLAIQWSRRHLGLDKLDPNALKQTRAKIKSQIKTDEENARAAAAKRSRLAQAIWLSGRADLENTPVALYLLGRGIGLGDLARPPGALRYVASLDYPPSLNDGLVTSWPAMVAAITNGRGEHIATHRTFLHSPMGGVVKKAPVKDAKLTLGSYRGGYIPLSRGASGKSLKDAPAGDKVIICEGIEDGLSLALSLPEYRVLAAISVSNFMNIDLPKNISEVVIAADNDGEDTPAGRALQSAIDRFIDQGRDVFEARSPIGKDFNDALTAEELQEQLQGAI